MDTFDIAVSHLSLTGKAERESCEEGTTMGEGETEAMRGRGGVLSGLNSRD